MIKKTWFLSLTLILGLGCTQQTQAVHPAVSWTLGTAATLFGTYLVWKFCSQKHDGKKSTQPIDPTTKTENLEETKKQEVLEEKKVISIEPQKTKDELAKDLLRACENNRIEEVKRLIEEFHVDIETRNNDHETPLLIVCRKGHIKIADFLIGKNPNKEAEDENKQTALQVAYTHDKYEIIELLVDKKANISVCNKYGYPLICCAALTGNLKVVQLLSTLKNIEATDPFGDTPLHIATQKGYLQMVIYLIKAGATINPKNSQSETPLHCASKRGDVDIVKVLLENKANTEIEKTDKRTPLLVASANGHKDVILLLMQNSANTKVTDSNGWDMVKTMELHGYSELAKEFSKK